MIGISIPTDFTEIAVRTGTTLELQVGRYDPSDESESRWGDTPYPRISFRSLKHPRFNTVQHISLRYSQVAQLVDTEALRACRDLTHFEIRGNNPISEFNVEDLQKCSQMRYFDLSNSQIHTFDFTIVQSWPNLELFSFTYNQIQGLDLTPFAHHPSLETINLGGNPVVELNLKPPLSCPSLTRIFLSTPWFGGEYPNKLAHLVVPNPPPPMVNPALRVYIPSRAQWNGGTAYYTRKVGSGADTVTLTTK